MLILDPQHDGSVVQLRVVLFEHLSATAANRRLLHVTTRHPDATIVTEQSTKPPGKSRQSTRHGR
jgi:hypothetical protein